MLVKKYLCSIIAQVSIILILGIAFTIAMPSIIVILYFGKVSFIPVKPFHVKSGACVISDVSISWPFLLLEAILVDVSMAGEFVTSNNTEELNMVEYDRFVISHLTKKEMVVLHQIHRCQCIPSDQAMVDFSR